LIDPAVYYGHREADLALTGMFGGFSESFYAAYREAYPLEAGFARRQPLYQFYHWLNHLNLFGRSYLPAVLSALQELGR
jgi:fructosamine-3-kinase